MTAMSDPQPQGAELVALALKCGGLPVFGGSIMGFTGTGLLAFAAALRSPGPQAASQGVEDERGERLWAETLHAAQPRHHEIREAARSAGAFMHRDGCIYFTNTHQLHCAILALASPPAPALASGAEQCACRRTPQNYICRYCKERETKQASETAAGAVQQAIEALEAAKNGLEWYRDARPMLTDGSDDEMDAQIDAAIAALAATPPAATQVPSDLHAAIMNLPGIPERHDAAFILGYRAGHRDARHGAAELAQAALRTPAATQGDKEPS